MNEPASSPSEPSARRAAMTLGAIVLLALVLRITIFAGFGATDDANYARIAWQMSEGTFSYRHHGYAPVFPLRPGLLQPVVAAYHVLGVREAAILAYPLAMSLAGIVLAYVAGRVFFTRQAGLLAAAIMAVVPMDVHSATMLMPDCSGAVWGSAGVLLAYLAGRQDRSGRALALGLAGGLCLGISWLHKESVAYLAPFLGVALAWAVWKGRARAGALVGVAAAGAAVVLAESVFYYSRTGDWLWRVHEMRRNFDVARNMFFAEGSPMGWEKGQYADALLRRLFVSGPKGILANVWLAFLPGVALVVLAWAAIRRHRSYAFVGAWLVTLILLYNFATTRLDYYAPLVLLERYLFPLVLPATLVVAGALAAALAQPRPRALAWVGRHCSVLLVAALVVACGAALAGRTLLRQRGKSPRCPAARAVHARLAETDVVYTDWRNGRALRFLRGYAHNATVRNMKDITTQPAPEGCHILVDPRQAGLYRAKNDLPDVYRGHVPPTWHVRWKGWGSTLYKVARTRATTPATASGPTDP